MEDEEEVLSASDHFDSSDEFTDDRDDADYGDDNDDGYDEASVADSPPSDEELKSKNVDALLRWGLFIHLLYKQPNFIIFIWSIYV